jgi:hypothetical protein
MELLAVTALRTLQVHFIITYRYLEMSVIHLVSSPLNFHRKSVIQLTLMSFILSIYESYHFKSAGHGNHAI